MAPVRPPLLAALLAGLALPATAHALSCEEVLAMVEVGVPDAIVAQTIDDSGGLFGPEALGCLERGGAPEEVLAAARALEPGIDDPDVVPLADEAVSGHAADAPPREISQALKLSHARKPMSASLALSDLLEEDRYPEHRGQLHYHLARNLHALELTHSARAHYLEVLKLGTADPYFEHALLRLVSIAEETGDTTELKRVVARFPADHWPQRAQATGFYLQGLRQFEQDELERALGSLERVPTHSPHGLQARYLEGVIRHRQGRVRSAVQAFQEVIATEAEAPTRAEAQRLRDLKNLALVNVARIHYGLERYQRAEELYALVEPTSAPWPTARLEMAWAQFRQADTSGSLGQILTVRSPYFDTEPFLPEAEILRALNRYSLCEHDEVQRILVDFEARVRPQQQELQAFAARHASPEGRQLAELAWATYFEGFPADSVLTHEIFAHMLRNRDLATQAQRIRSLERELELLPQHKARWTASMEPRLRPILEAERKRTRHRAGLLLLAESARTSAQLKELLAQSEVIRFEAVDGTRIRAEELAAGAIGLEPMESELPSYATDPRDIYWPFNGEFWEDELGSYVFAGESLCR